jgi:serine/threonine protein kinase
VKLRGRRSERRRKDADVPTDDPEHVDDVEAAPEPVIDLGLRLPGYQLLGPIATGGFSTVYRAYQQAYDRVVAVKVLTVDLTDTRSRERFTRECATTGRLTGHPNIVTVLEAGFTSTHQPFLAMPLLKRSLADQLAAEGPLDVPDVLRIGVKIAGALETAHRHRILHRDLKPGNILVSEYGEPALADFGIAAVESAHQHSMTFGAITPLHAPPELIDNHRATAASDVYSLASTLYKLVEGHAPHEGSPDDSVLVVLHRIMSDPVRMPSRAGVPLALGKVLIGGLEKNPVHRPASAAEFGEALRDVERGLGLIPTEQVYTSPTVAVPAAAPLPPSDASATIHPDALPPAVERTAARRRAVLSEPEVPSPDTPASDRKGRKGRKADPAGPEPDPPAPRSPASLPAAASVEGTIVRSRHGFERRAPEDETEQKRPRPGTALTVATAALILTAVAVAGFFLLRPEDEPTTEATTTTTPTSSAPSTSSTVPAPPPNRVENLQVSRTIDGRQAILSWENTNAEGTQYYVLLDPALPGKRNLPASGPDEAAVSGLNPDTEYCFRVFSFPGNDPANEPVFSQLVCPPPRR